MSCLRVPEWCKSFYGLLFRASAAATQKLAQDPRFVGGQVGIIGVLHTWGRTLTYYPHVHYLVPGGGLAADGQTWLPARKTFLMPVKALARLFRGAFRHALRETPYYAEVPATAWQQAWIVHCQPLGDGRPALKYLAPYIFRVALSNRRLVCLEAGQVTFRYWATDTGKLKQSTLRAEEFIRRFLQHVLPKGFVKVRYYGFFSPRHRQQLAALRQRLRRTFPRQPPPQKNRRPPSPQSYWSHHAGRVPTVGRRCTSGKSCRRNPVSRRDLPQRGFLWKQAVPFKGDNLALPRNLPEKLGVGARGSGWVFIPVRGTNLFCGVILTP